MELSRAGLRRGLGVGITTALVLTALSLSHTAASARDPGPSAADNAAANAASVRDRAKYYDSRQDPGAAKQLRDRQARDSARPKAGVSALRRELGTQAVVSMDPLTTTAR